MRLALLGTFATEAGLLVLGIGTGAVAARLLLPEGRGALAAVLFWPQLLAGVGLLSLSDAATYRVAARPKGRHITAASALTLALLLGVVTAAAGYLLMPGLLGENRSDLVPLARAYLVAFVPFNFVALALLSVDHGRLAFGRYNSLRLLVPTLYLAGLVTLWAADAASVELVAAINCAATVLTALVRLTLQGRTLLARPAFEELRDLLRTALSFHPATLALVLTAQADRLAVLVLWDNVVLGHYVVALTIASSGLAILTGVFQRVLFPHLAQQGEKARRARLLARGVRHATLFLATLSIPLAVAIPWLVPPLFGPAFEDATPVALALVVAYPFVALKTIIIQGLRGFGEARPGFVASTISLGLFFALVWPAGQTAGLIGVAASLAMAHAAGLWYLANHLKRGYGVPVGDLWGLTPDTIAEMRTRLLGRPGISPWTAT